MRAAGQEMEFPRGEVVPAFLGYRAGLRQPSATVALRLEIQEQNDFGQMDALLEARFGVAPMAEPAWGEGGASRQAHAHAWRIALLARELLQAAYIPVFELARILDIRRDPQGERQFRILFASPSIDGLSLRGLGMAYDAAAEIIAWAARSNATAVRPRELDHHLQEGVIATLRREVPGGMSTVPVLASAYREDIPVRHLGGGVYQLGWGARSRWMDRSAVDTDSAIGAWLTQKKHWAAQVIRAVGLPAPEHLLATDRASAEQAAKQLGWPLVVKPADRDRSEGVTVGIRDDQRFQMAFEHAYAHSRAVLIEREVPGPCYRLLVANGRFLYALSRRPKAVVGDGSRSIAELLEEREAATNAKPPWQRGRVIRIDEQTCAVLAAQGLRPDSIPENGVAVALRDIESSEWGGEIGDATDMVHPENIDIALRAAALFGLGNAGIDIISPDIGVPWFSNGAIINEVNYAPYFGGNQIAKAKLPDFFKEFMPGNGRIPVIVYLGGEAAWRRGKERQSEMIERGIRCYLSSHRQTLDADRNPLHLSAPELHRRALALSLNRDVEALILVVQDDDLRRVGMPFDRIDEVHRCPGELRYGVATSRLSPEVRKLDMENWLRGYLLPSAGKLPGC